MRAAYSQCSRRIGMNQMSSRTRAKFKTRMAVGSAPSTGGHERVNGHQQRVRSLPPRHRPHWNVVSTRHPRSSRALPRLVPVLVLPCPSAPEAARLSSSSSSSLVSAPTRSLCFVFAHRGGRRGSGELGLQVPEVGGGGVTGGVGAPHERTCLPVPAHSVSS
jgi:hypothetical protein